MFYALLRKKTPGFKHMVSSDTAITYHLRPVISASTNRLNLWLSDLTGHPAVNTTSKHETNWLEIQNAYQHSVFLAC